MPPNASSNGVTAGVPVHASAGMKLLDIRLKPSTAILTSLIGSFTEIGTQEIAMLKPGGLIEIHRIIETVVTEEGGGGGDDGNDETAGGGGEEAHRGMKLQCRCETRSVLRSAVKVRYLGERRDLLAVSSDSGALSILDFEKAVLKIVHCVDYGKTGCRRDTPGQYVAAESRAVMISAVEKRRLVYVLNRDATGHPTIASPLEAHRSRTITFGLAALDNGHANPIFAALEWQYPDLETDEEEAALHATSPVKELAYYELDLGLNHVSRRWATTVLPTAVCLASIPGGAEGPGGVLIGAEDYIAYLHESNNNSSSAGAAKIVCAIPRRRLHPVDKGILVTHIAVHRQKKAKFFALAQTELGDVYKITVVVSPDNKRVITGLKIALLDTLPVASSLNISDLGLLFAAAEFGNHQLYEFLGFDFPDAPTSRSEDLEKARADNNSMEDDQDSGFFTTATAVKVAPTFDPTILKNLAKLLSLDNAAPTTAVMVGELAGNEVSPQIYTLNGRGPHSQLSITRHGASVTELAVSDLPGVPGGIFTVADNTGDSRGLDRYIVVSFVDATLVLSVGESVEEVGKESEFVTDAPTLACSALGKDGSLCQVHPKGVRHINKGQPTIQWHCPGLKQIECAAANEGQVMIALAGGEIIYFELDSMSGKLAQNGTRELGVDVCCLDVGTIAKGRNRSMFAAIGCRDQTVRIVTLAPNSQLAQKSSTALKSRPHSVTLHAMGSDGNDDLTLMIGLEDGSSLRVSVDPITGSIGTSPTRRFLGARPVAVSRINLDAQPGLLMLSSRPWISRCDPTTGKHVMAPLSYAPLDHGCLFRSENVREGVIATSGKTLRILSVDASGMSSNDDEAFNTKNVQLRYTPRQMALVSTASSDPATKRRIALVVAESDYNEYGMEEKKAMGFDTTGEGKAASSQGARGEDDAMDMDEDSDNEGGEEKKENADDEGETEDKRTPIRGPVPPGPGHWGSCIRLLDTSNNCESLDCVEMGRNEAALCCASVRFHSKGGEALLAVGTVTGMTLQPMKHTACHIVLYRILNGERFQLLHRTSVDDGPILAMAHFQGRLVVGIGKSLRLYEMGKRQLLRKCELRGLPSVVKAIQTLGDRAFVGDLMQSIQVVKYDISSNRLVLVALDANPRPIVAEEILDMRTVAVSDKFGNISILRLPKGADSGSVSAMDTTGDKALWEATREDAIPKLELLCQYYVGEVVTSMTNAPLVAGGPESLIYVTASGRIGALLPLSSRDQVDFFTKLYGELRAKAPKPTGRDPWAYRSYYAPAMHVIDGELCDAFSALPHSEQMKVAEAMELSIGEILKKIEDTRNSLL